MSEQERYSCGNHNNGEGTGGDERIAFGPMAKGQKKYGSIITPNRLARQPTEEQAGFLYDVQSGDTMPGIAVKFGVTTEQIRRANQLWTNDSLFLRAKLFIPVPIIRNDGSNIPENHYTIPSVGSSSSFNDVQLDTQSNGHGGQTSASSISSPQEEISYTSTVSSNNKHWTHPLSDSFESEDCTVSPSSVKLETDSSTTSYSPYPVNGKSGHHYQGSNNSASNSNSMIWSPTVADRSSYQNHNDNRANQSNINEYASPQSHSTPVSPSTRKYLVRDHSEKSAEDFLARIDSAIESKKQQVKLNSDNFNSKPWVTFESDSESDQRSSSRTSLRTEGRHLRYSLRKLEKAQDELFEL